MSFAIPEPLKVEHARLHEKLEAAIAKGGRTGERACLVAERIHPHFVAEEEFAMPPLGLLAILARGNGNKVVTQEDQIAARAMADRLASEMSRMLSEHKQIVDALRSLTTAAEEEGHRDVVDFAEALMLHARTEEQVLYPASILVGRYLELMGSVR
ncbi:hemerythrin domain-containing protein [Cereibacter sphaeroides]|uniref:hemerythrin domain-containing protein n=1 Tax=Cereibacter sphaeroides TaxID=1063 RepID=UPI001F3F892D|nr:hemerythrin domain-containing protein [Cereibacter sphaeroides]MCE6966985.1 hemerythrin domain-containing protein [Cereibacter sphaeroides]MCE6967249.1 hemerythrin domain-containing protein [Cereibacter sphaeroides]